MGEYSPSEMANLNFFGNYCNISMQLEALKAFLVNIEDHINIKGKDLNQSVEGYDVHALENLQYHYEYTHGDLLRSSVIISLVVVLESEIHNYCFDFAKHMGARLSHRDFGGSLMNQFKTFMSKYVQSTFDFGSQTWEDLIGVYEFRNCFVHNRGSLDGFGKRKILESFFSRLGEVEVSGNEVIHLGRDQCLVCVDIVEKFFHEITSFALIHFPGQYR
jgi:hypothetical protein